MNDVDTDQRRQTLPAARQLRHLTDTQWVTPYRLTEMPSDVLNGNQVVSGGLILGLEVVLPTGEVVRTGASLLARELGERDSAALLAGPDGTLAVITELTVTLDRSRAYPYFLDRPAISCLEDLARLDRPAECYGPLGRRWSDLRGRRRDGCPGRRGFRLVCDIAARTRTSRRR